jgi:acetyl/propionyl-CoA carboxylase alpha subunit/acetyl-CoA carboxylase carboxyltransferase component
MDAPTLFVANRGEVAVRVLRAAREVGLRSCAVRTRGEGSARHARLADEVRVLPGEGPRAYLDRDGLLEAAEDAGAQLLHPGYGFLSEDAALAERCAERGITFVGPPADVLRRLGDKLAARALAAEHDVPVPAGTAGAVGIEEARDFLRELGTPAVTKAVAGGGGRGMRVVEDATALESAWEGARAEAAAAFGDGSLYLERLLSPARHVEVQVVGDGQAVGHLWERDCSLQRRHQKLIEIAPAPALDDELRDELLAAALRMAEAVGYRSLGTFEFLVPTDPAPDDDQPRFVFIEANPRLQVEHTVTEEVTGVDLVASQLRIALGASLSEVGLVVDDVPSPRGTAIQLRLNTETLQADGTVRARAGRLDAFDPPTGPGVRVDTAVATGSETDPAFDPLLAKIVVHHAGGPEGAVARASRALDELRVEGVDTNATSLARVLGHPDVAGGGWQVHTRWVEEHLTELVDSDADVAGDVGSEQGSVLAPTSGTVSAVEVAAGDEVAPGTTVAIIESMKVEHPVRPGYGGRVRRVAVGAGDQVAAGDVLLDIDVTGVAAADEVDRLPDDLGEIRDDLEEVLERQRLTRDEARPQAVAKRRGRGQRTVRENIDALCDPGSFTEYGSLVIAAQRQRRSQEELIRRTPADGLVAGFGRINGERFPDEDASCAVMSYDATVLAGTQGMMNHLKKDRMFELIERLRTPVVLFAEGGGGRPGDTDVAVVSGLHTMAFHLFGGLSGRVPLVGIASRYCFAGNAALLGCCDVIIATEDASIGMGGPAMIEGGGLGTYAPEEIGPVEVQAPNGVVDLVVNDEVEAVAVARDYLAYFQGTVADWDAHDQLLLRHLVPENRKRTYDVRRVIETLADVGSVLELRRVFGSGIVTALIRIEGRPLGLIANDPRVLGGAIDSDAADKAARFVRLCDAFGLPVLSLCDTPGFMVGPEAEATAQVRHFARMFVAGANITVPFMTVVLRKGYGLGAQAMAAGSFHAPLFTVSWPTGEFGGMNLEGAVQLGFRDHLDAIEAPGERQERFEQMVAFAYEHGKALNVATYFEIDDVIDPAETRGRVLQTLRATPVPPWRPDGRRATVDTW